MLKENHGEFQGLVNELSAEGEATDEVVPALEEVLNKELGGDMQVAAADILETLELAHDKLIRLGVGEDLTDEERKERQVMMLFRRLQMDEGTEIAMTDESSGLSIFTTPLTELGLSAADDDSPGTPVVSTSEPAKATAAPAKPEVVQPEVISESPQAADDGASPAAAAQNSSARQGEAAKAAQAATEQAVAATKDARAATAEARKARDELRAAEKDARAAIKELILLQKQAESQSETTDPAKGDKDDGPDDKDAAAAKDDAPDDKDASVPEDDAAETPKADPEPSEKEEAASSDESS
ncbi:MAG: hypothetical protein P8J37_09865 [Fuerstiella sp.]|nr:hypothetical protein [Fuerstiella sp.]